MKKNTKKKYTKKAILDEKVYEPQNREKLTAEKLQTMIEEAIANGDKRFVIAEDGRIGLNPDYKPS